MLLLSKSVLAAVQDGQPPPSVEAVEYLLEITDEQRNNAGDQGPIVTCKQVQTFFSAGFYLVSRCNFKMEFLVAVCQCTENDHHERRYNGDI